jgi:hypothetical protein
LFGPLTALDEFIPHAPLLEPLFGFFGTLMELIPTLHAHDPTELGHRLWGRYLGGFGFEFHDLAEIAQEEIRLLGEEAGFLEFCCKDVPENIENAGHQIDDPDEDAQEDDCDKEGVE